MLCLPKMDFYGYKTNMSKELEEGSQLCLDFSKLKKIAMGTEDVIPVVVQHADTLEVLILAYVNELALAETIKRQVAVFWSTSRNELWIKGATSGDFLHLVNIRVNCEQNSLLYLVRPVTANSCHTNRSGCYYRQLENNKLSFIHFF